MKGSGIEVGCWVLGIALLGIYFGARAEGEIGRRQAIEAFAVAHTLDQTRWSDGRSQAYAAQASEFDAAEPPPAAILRIRRVGLEVPVFGDAGERNLNRGAGLVEGTALPGSDGNIAIAAHRDGYFRVLKDVALGDLVELESAAGRRTYRITDLVVVEPTDVWPLYATDEPTVTLVTCYPFYFAGSAPQRFIVRAVAAEQEIFSNDRSRKGIRRW